MNLTAEFTALEAVRAEWLIVPVWENESLPRPVAALDARLGGLLTRLRERGDLAGKTNELTPLLNPAGVAAERLLLVGLGKRDTADRARLTDAAAAAARGITGKQRGRVAFALPEGVLDLRWDDVAKAVGV
ncbi:MAG TPA: M17 family peptidase N-terminal domain-containing protein, partial [Gemmataceae bacterium]|nr:M17 family peptidase N-terminal domain-containing protein [Gemmataceae bacterium]